MDGLGKREFEGSLTIKRHWETMSPRGGRRTQTQKSLLCDGTKEQSKKQGDDRAGGYGHSQGQEDDVDREHRSKENASASQNSPQLV